MVEDLDQVFRTFLSPALFSSSTRLCASSSMAARSPKRMAPVGQDCTHAGMPPALILSLHSFTPQLASRPEIERPWQCGVLYNQDDRAARIALRLLAAEDLNVGDQQPYSGQLLNETMNRHAEADGRPYFGIEIRQDLLTTPAGHAEWAARLVRVCNQVALEVAE